MTKLDQYRDYIEANPGCSSHDIATAFGLTVHSVRKILQKDIVRGDIDSEVIGNVCHYWVQSRRPKPPDVVDRKLRIMNALKGQKAMKVSDIATATGLSHRHANAVLTRMEKSGQVKATLFGYPPRWYLA